MKYAYIITIIFLLFSCGKQVEQPAPIDTIATDEKTVPVDTSVSEEQTESVTEKDLEAINTMVGEESTQGGGFGVPSVANGER